MTKIITVRGNWGTLTADAKTGLVNSYIATDEALELGEGYADIGSLDVAEWKRAYPGRDITFGSRDILDFGYWNEQEEYTAPELDWRKYSSES